MAALPKQVSLRKDSLMRLAPITIVSLGIVCLLAAGLKVGDPPGMRLKTFADSFLRSLDEKQKSVALMPYDTPKRVDWHFIPKKTRKGLVMKDMNTAQRTAALRLVRAALSEAAPGRPRCCLGIP